MTHHSMETGFDGLDAGERPVVVPGVQTLGAARTARAKRSAGYRACPFRRSLLDGLLRVTEPSRRHLRAIEYVLYHALTHKDGAVRKLRPHAIQVDILAQHRIHPDRRAGQEAVQRYQNIIDQALAVRSLEELEASGLLESAREIKYELGKRYLNQEAVCAAVACLLVFERLVMTRGFIGEYEPRDPAWREGRLPIEPHPDRPLLPGGAEEIVDVWEQFEAQGGAEPMGHAVPMHEVGGSGRGEQGVGEAELPLAGTSRPISSSEPSGQQSRTVPDPPWEIQARRMGRAAPYSSHEAQKGRRRVRVSKQGRLSEQVRRFRHVMLGLAGLCLAVALLAGGQILVAGGHPVPVVSPAYQAYDLSSHPRSSVISSARRLDGRLLLVARDAWNDLTVDERHAVVAEFARTWLEQDGILEIVVFDDRGRVLADARGGRVSVTPLPKRRVGGSPTRTIGLREPIEKGAGLGTR